MDSGFLRQAWEWAQSDGAANLSNVVMGLAVVFAVLDYRREQQRERLEEQEKREMAAEALLVEAKKLDLMLMEMYFDVLDDFKDPKVRDHISDLKPEDADTQKISYTKLIMIFAKAFDELHDKEHAKVKSLWHMWQDEIDDWMEKPNFRKALDELLVGESEEFDKFMRHKRDNIPMIAVSGVVHPAP